MDDNEGLMLNIVSDVIASDVKAEESLGQKESTNSRNNYDRTNKRYNQSEKSPLKSNDQNRYVKSNNNNYYNTKNNNSSNTTTTNRSNITSNTYSSTTTNSIVKKKRNAWNFNAGFFATDNKNNTNTNNNSNSNNNTNDDSRGSDFNPYVTTVFGPNCESFSDFGLIDRLVFAIQGIYSIE